MRDVEPLPPRDLLLVLEQGERMRRLRLSAHQDGPRVHLQCARVHSYAGPPGPFFRRLAEELPGARLARIGQVAGDRILRIELRDPPGGRALGLLAELTGRHSNLVLVDGQDRVLELLVEAPARGGKAPRLVPVSYTHLTLPTIYSV